MISIRIQLQISPKERKLSVVCLDRHLVTSGRYGWYQIYISPILHLFFVRVTHAVSLYDKSPLILFAAGQQQLGKLLEGLDSTHFFAQQRQLNNMEVLVQVLDLVHVLLLHTRTSIA